MKNYFAHKTAEISSSANIGKNTKIWHYCHIRENARIGENCNVGRNVYVDFGVIIGNNCKIQNNCSIYHGVTIENGVFIGPHVVFANDKIPRAITPEGKTKTNDDWIAGKIRVNQGTSIGAHSVILPNVIIGKFAMIGAGSIVTKDVPDFALVFGNPAKIIGTVDKRGYRVK
jgi:acetyltransferase-like isoleucine patch superfamily enzyme